LRLLSIHLKSGCWDDPLDTRSGPCHIIARQLPVLEGWIDARARERTPFAVLGDFNRRFEPPDAFWPEIDDGHPAGAGPTDAVAGTRRRCGTGESPLFVDPLLSGPRAAPGLDPAPPHQLVFAPQAARHKRPLSDHCPIGVTLALPAPAARR